MADRLRGGSEGSSRRNRHEQGVLSARAPATLCTVPNSFRRRQRRGLHAPGATGSGRVVARAATEAKNGTCRRLTGCANAVGIPSLFPRPCFPCSLLARPLALRDSEVTVRRVVGRQTQTEEGCDRIGGLHEQGVLSARAPATHYAVPNSFRRRLQRASAEEASRWVVVIGPGAWGWGSVLASPANVVPVLGMTRALTYY
ncbi:hypothetical protein BJV78DRAFT_1158668 [Lactifluus subvellereus]|nr:hypothetical protein BJV78DRAFT_1158668 [Lactifluus subvellereus]